MQPLTQHKMTAREYFSIGELKAKTELIDGVIYDMVPPGPKHSNVLRKILARLYRNEHPEITISPEQPINLQDFTAPQPDIAILKNREEDYDLRHPLAEDVLVVIELSDSTIEYDTTTKAKIYADAGIPEYFIIDLKNSKVLSYSNPGQTGYEKTGETQDIHISCLEIKLDLSELL